MRITIPEFALVVLIGPTSSGKSTFAARHFRSTEVVSSDTCRAMLTDDENAMDVNAEAFELLNHIVASRMRLRRLTVIDATNVRPDARQSLIALARDQDCLAVAIVFDLPTELIARRSRTRTDRNLPGHVARRHAQLLHHSLRDLEHEGFGSVHVLRTAEDVASVTLERQRLVTDRRDDHGPFDIIGDVHGCRGELHELLALLGYAEQDGVPQHPANRRAVFVGDLVNRGPDTPGVLHTVMDMLGTGNALCVAGNHDVQLLSALLGQDREVSPRVAASIAQVEHEPAEFRDRVVSLLEGLVSHYVLDDGRLVVSHAGLAARYHGRSSQRVLDIALYGETTGEANESGLPVRHDWAADYRGSAMVVYGHRPRQAPQWVNGTICIDTGCVYGGRLTALRYPERELRSVAAHCVHHARDV